MDLSHFWKNTMRCILSDWWLHLRHASKRPLTLFLNSSITSSSRKGDHSEKSNRKTFSFGKSKSQDRLSPMLLEDGSHPYFPGTPWNELELAGTVNVDCRTCPKPTRSRVWQKEIEIPDAMMKQRDIFCFTCVDAVVVRIIPKISNKLIWRQFSPRKGQKKPFSFFVVFLSNFNVII